jgi:hypothetical protein
MYVWRMRSHKELNTPHYHVSSCREMLVVPLLEFAQLSCMKTKYWHVLTSCYRKKILPWTRRTRGSVRASALHYRAAVQQALLLLLSVAVPTASAVAAAAVISSAAQHVLVLRQPVTTTTVEAASRGYCVGRVHPLLLLLLLEQVLRSVVQRLQLLLLLAQWRERLAQQQSCA